MPMHDIGFILAGFLVGQIIGLKGVGGSSLMAPILIFFSAKPYLAVGTDLLFSAFTKLGGTLRLARAGLVDWLLLAGSMPGIWLGTRFVSRLHERVIRSTLSVLLAWGGLKLIAI